MPDHPFGERFARAIALIDEANAADPTTIAIDGEDVPKEPAHARMMSRWVVTLRPDASEALQLAARAHHIRRWEVPRDTYPEGRQGYLNWRVDLYSFHAEKAAEILATCGYDQPTIDRVSAIIHKQKRTLDEDVQTYEDALNLVFLETQFHQFSAEHDEEKLLNIVRRTWRKMSPAAHEAALGLSFDPADLALIQKALA